MGYKGTESLTTPIKRHGLSLLVLTKENGLTDLKLVSSISKSTRNLTIIPSGVLQEHLLKHATKPKAKEIGNILYEVLASGHPVFNEEVLDDWGTSIEELSLTAPQLFDASKRVNGYIFGLVKNLDLANTSRFWISFLVPSR